MTRKRKADVIGCSIYPNKRTWMKNLHSSEDMLFTQYMKIVPFDEKAIVVKAGCREKGKKM